MSTVRDCQTWPIPNSKNKWIAVCLFRGVSNARSVREKIVNGALEAAILDCRLIADPFQILVAAHKAQCAAEQGTMKTKNVFAETIYCLSNTGKISESFKNFGISDESKDMLVVTFEDSKEPVKFLAVKEVMEGEMQPLDQLPHCHDVDAIVKHYKISELELRTSSLAHCIATRISTKDLL